MTNGEVAPPQIKQLRLGPSDIPRRPGALEEPDEV